MRNLTLMAVLLLAGCGSDSDPSAPSSVLPSSTPAPTSTAASSSYAGNWAYRTTLMAVDDNCGHTPADIGMAEGPFAVAVASNGTFTLPGGSRGTISSAGDVSITLAPGAGDCGGGTGAGGCRDTDHCDGTSEQSGDVKRWTLFRQ